MAADSVGFVQLPSVSAHPLGPKYQEHFAAILGNLMLGSQRLHLFLMWGDLTVVRADKKVSTPVEILNMFLFNWARTNLG